MPVRLFDIKRDFSALSPRSDIHHGLNRRSWRLLSVHRSTPLDSNLATRIASPLIPDPQEFSIDDLLAPLPDTISLGGTGPFVINLRASNAPVSLPLNDIAGCQHAYMYRIQRIEDGRMRYRLRLGPFVREDEADAVLLHVRNDHPGALTATASAEDLSAIATLQAKAGVLPRSAEKPPSGEETRSAEKLLSVEEMRAVENPSSVEEVPAVEKRPSVEEMRAVLDPRSVEERPASIARATGIADTRPGSSAATASSATISSAEPLTIDSTSFAPPKPMAGPAPEASQLLPVLMIEHLELMPEDISPPARNPHPGDAGIDATSPSLDAPRPKTPDAEFELTLEFEASEPVPPPNLPSITDFSPEQPKSSREAARSIETTQTLRALTAPELEDDGATRWFVIQLALADHAFDPATVPNLDIFSLYTLYSVAGADQGRVMHALRLGFFGEEMAARAVANYLTTYYDKSVVKQVSTAERERFANQRLDARKDVGETGQHSTIEITSMRAAPKVRIARPAAAAATSRQMSGQPAKRDRPGGLFASLPWVKRRS